MIRDIRLYGGRPERQVNWSDFVTLSLAAYCIYMYLTYISFAYNLIPRFIKKCSEHQRPLAGNDFKHDNGIVFDFLKSWTINGPAYPWMKQFNATRNGRGSWLALLSYYEGNAARDRLKETAYASIANARYHGEKKHFSFDTYVNIHQEAYQDLCQNNAIIPVDKRV